MLDQRKTPILETLRVCGNTPHAPFYTPGHKRGQGISPLLSDWVGTSVFTADLPELPGLDNLFAPQGVILEAQTLAADAFGAEQTWFLVNGSTAGVIAAILATCGAGDQIILPRNVHQSVISGLILSGAIPIFLNPDYDPEWDLTLSISPNAIAAALNQYPQAKAVLLVSPTYQGICGNVARIAELTHQHNIPLLVDEAHGPHFAFHPDLPTPALAAGADLTVQSIHKVLGAMTQASMLHVQGARIDRHQLSQALQLLQSSSPNYLLLASLDAARQQMATQGKPLLTQTLQLADDAKHRLHQIPGISVLEIAAIKNSGINDFNTCRDLDPTRLTVNLSPLGLSGYDVDEIFTQELGVIAELPLPQNITFILSIGNISRDIDQLVQAFTTLAPKYYENVKISPLSPPPPLPLTTRVPLSPRDAWFAPSQKMPRQQTPGCISAELVCPYPPGIPILLPGEMITQEALDYLQQILDLGGTITGCSDPSLETLKISQVP